MFIHILCGEIKIVKLNTYDVEKKYTSIEEYLKFDRKNFMEIYNCNLLNSLCNKIYDLNIIKKNNIKLKLKI